MTQSFRYTLRETEKLSILKAESGEGARLLARAQRVGEIRRDIRFDDVVCMATAISLAATSDERRIDRLVHMFVDGMRTPKARRQHATGAPKRKRARRATTAWSVAALWLALAVPQARAEVEHIEVDPSALNAQAPEIHGPHLALFDPAARSRHRLVVFLPGTDGVATRMADTLDVIAQDGYHVLSLDYPNSVITTTFRPSKDVHAFDAYRRAVVHGGKVDETLTVEAASGIEARIADALRHLAAHSGSKSWREFWRGKDIAWDKLILAGHSQGSGHAAFIAHEHKVAKVLIVAGPQDYLTELAQPATWLSAPSRTPRERFRALLHRDDSYDVNLQIAANRALLGPNAIEPVHFAAELPKLSVAPAILVSDGVWDANADAASAHVSLARPRYAAVWLYLLAH